MESTLRSLTVFQHGLVVVLATIGFVRGLSLGANPIALGLATLAFLGWYACGIGRARRRTVHGDVAPPGRSVLLGWLLGLTVLWLILVAVSVEFVWLAFSLWLLAGHFLPGRWTLPYAGAVLAVAVLAPWQAGHLTAAQVLGPAIGAVFAVVVSRGQVRLVRDGLERQRLVTSLVAAQAEAEQLHAQLAATERESGVLSERTRLARDIHDTLAQGFSSILLLARAGSVTSGDAGLRDLLTRIEASAATNLDEARRVVGALAGVGDGGLVAALRRITDAFAEESGVATDLRVDGDLSGLPTTVEVALVRTAQGALANVRRHAHADRVVVSLVDAGDSVRLDVVDDGVGFDPDSVAAQPGSPNSGGYGLPSTRARLRELGGGLEVESTPGDGTVLSAFVPLGGGPG